jgi:hypothetical protein
MSFFREGQYDSSDTCFEIENQRCDFKIFLPCREFILFIRQEFWKRNISNQIPTIQKIFSAHINDIIFTHRISLAQAFSFSAFEPRRIFRNSHLFFFEFNKRSFVFGTDLQDGTSWMHLFGISFKIWLISNYTQFKIVGISDFLHRNIL